MPASESPPEPESRHGKKLEKAGQWLTLVANFGVVAGLVFLGIEVQQNTMSLQAAAIQESTNVAREQILLLATDAELNRLLMHDYDTLGPEDQRRIHWFDRSFWLGMQGQYRQWRLGALPEEEWSVWRGIICSNFSGAGERPRASGGRRLWPENRTRLLAEFVDFVERECV